MAIYRNVQTSFWTDPKVADDFTPEDKFFYLYLFTRGPRQKSLQNKAKY